MNSPDQTPPQSVEAERAVLGAGLLDKECIRRVGGLQPEDFYYQKHRIIFTILRDMARRGEPIDYLTVEDRLRATEKLEEIGGSAYLSVLTDATPTLSNVEGYAAIVQEKGRARRLIAGSSDLIRRLYEGETSSEVAPDLAKLLGIGTDGKYHEYDARDGFEDLQKYQSGEMPGLLDVGFDCLEPYLPTCEELIMIAARPSMGKTALAIEMAERIAKRGDAVLFISAEMSGQGITYRRVYYRTGVPTIRMRRKNGLYGDEHERIANAFGEISESKLKVYAGTFRPLDISALIRAEKIKDDIKAVFIDHLGKTKFPRKERQDVEYGDMTASLADTAKKIRVPIFLLHQLNRKVESREDKRPNLSDLRDSGRIEEDADKVWFLYRENRYNNNADDKFEIIAAKTRDGPTGVAEARFDPRTGRVGDR